MNDDINDKKLQKLIKQFSGPLPYAKVGILKSGGRRDAGDKTNAQIGAIHEFGSPTNNIPQRSFLRVPIADNLKVQIEKIKKQKNVSIEDMIYQIGAVAKAIVQEGFTNDGYGKWELTHKYMRQFMKGASREEAGNILVDTGQLRDSIDFEVVS